MSIKISKISSYEYWHDGGGWGSALFLFAPGFEVLYVFVFIKLIQRLINLKQSYEQLVFHAIAIVAIVDFVYWHYAHLTMLTILMPIVYFSILFFHQYEKIMSNA